jgi:hypothetical protein
MLDSALPETVAEAATPSPAAELSLTLAPEPGFVVADPAPGRYASVPEADYFAAEAINSSLLKLMGRSPAHCRESAVPSASVEAKPDTTAQLVGRMLHCAALEPERFEQAYCLAPDPADHGGAMTDLASFKATAKALGLKVGGSKADLKARILETDPAATFWEDLLPLLVGDRLVLKQADWDMGQAVLAALAGNERAARALSGGVAEETLVWHDTATGLAMKARMDYYREDLGVIFDIKTTTDARPSAVSRDIFKYGYHKSAAHYLQGAKALGMPADNFAWIFIEKEAPYAIGLYFCSPDCLQMGREDMARHALDYADCEQSNAWPAYSPDFQTIDLPGYAKNQ